MKHLNSRKDSSVGVPSPLERARVRLLLVALILIASGCRTMRQHKFTHESKTLIKETLRDTVVHIPADRSHFRAKLGLGETGKPIIKEVLHAQVGKKAKLPQVRIQDQMLQVDCLCDSMSIYLQLKDRHITDMLKETVYVPTEKPFSPWQQVQLWLGRVLLIGLMVWVILIVIIKRTV